MNQEEGPKKLNFTIHPQVVIRCNYDGYPSDKMETITRKVIQEAFNAIADQYKADVAKHINNNLEAIMGSINEQLMGMGGQPDEHPKPKAIIQPFKRN